MSSAEPTPITPFCAAHRWRPDGDGGWEGEVTEDWLQGRGAFGGLQAAAGLRAMQSLVDANRQPRTLTVHFAGPLVVGSARLTAAAERAGGNVTHTSARLEQDGKIVALMLATFGAARDHWFEVPGEPAPDFRPAKVIELPQGPGIPAFTRYVHMDLIEGFPYGGAAEPVVSGWVRFREPEATVDAPLLAALGDVWPPAPVACMKTPRPSSSVDLTYHFLRPLPLDDVPNDGFFSFHAHSPAAREGYCEERGSLWDPLGRLVLRVRQLRAIY